MTCAAELRLVLDDADVAAQALGPDNDGHIEAEVEAGTLVLSAASPSPMGLLRSLDDALGCLRATGIE